MYEYELNVCFNLTTQAAELLFDPLHQSPMITDSVVLQCQAGSQVWLRSDVTGCYVWGDGDSGDVSAFSTFGGFILQ